MTIRTFCDKCGTPYEAEAFQTINVADTPELKARVISGELFIGTCPSCGGRKLISYPLIYRDPSEKLLLCLSARNINAEGFDGTARRVRDVGSLIEKIKIFDAGLDDVVVELVKYVTRQEIGKRVPLKFLRMDGADNEMIFTYPEKDSMQLLSVGFNVYEDCRGIVQRNPSMTRSLKGLAVVDEDWAGCFLG